MPLTPSPLIPSTSPLPNSGQQPPNKRALRVGAMATLLLLIVTLGAGQLLLPHILFLEPGLLSQAVSSTSAGSTATFQGFVYPWTRDERGGGYSTPASLQNMQSEAKIFHMNAVIIPVVADMPLRDDSVILWKSTEKGDIHTLPDSEYEQAITDAKKAGLVPILELQIRQQDPLSQGSQSSQLVGYFWSANGTSQVTGLGNGKQITVGPTEEQWFDNYTALAVHYAAISKQYQLPYFIFGSDLTSITYDTTGTKGDKNAIANLNVPGEPCSITTTGRRDCEWRDVIYAIRQPSYSTIVKHQSEVGGDYTGQLIYEASWSGVQGAYSSGATQPEFSSIAWWDAVNYIGVDAEFPLTQIGADVPVPELENAWNGLRTPDGAGGSGDIVANLQAVSQQFQKPIVFTTASYQSASGSNTGQPASCGYERAVVRYGGAAGYFRGTDLVGRRLLVGGSSDLPQKQSAELERQQQLGRRFAVDQQICRPVVGRPLSEPSLTLEIVRGSLFCSLPRRRRRLSMLYYLARRAILGY